MEYKKLSIVSRDSEYLEIDESVIVSPPTDSEIFLDNDGSVIECRTGGIFIDRALYLPAEYDYVLGVDDAGSKILVILNKE